MAGNADARSSTGDRGRYSSGSVPDYETPGDLEYATADGALSEGGALIDALSSPPEYAEPVYTGGSETYGTADNGGTGGSETYGIADNSGTGGSETYGIADNNSMDGSTRRAGIGKPASIKYAVYSKPAVSSTDAIHSGADAVYSEPLNSNQYSGVANGNSTPGAESAAVEAGEVLYDTTIGAPIKQPLPPAADSLYSVVNKPAAIGGAGGSTPTIRQICGDAQDTDGDEEDNDNAASDAGAYAVPGGGTTATSMTVEEGIYESQ